MATCLIARPSKIYPNWDFWFENIPSGNPAPDMGTNQKRSKRIISIIQYCSTLLHKPEETEKNNQYFFNIFPRRLHKPEEIEKSNQLRLEKNKYFFNLAQPIMYHVR
jgi:hypothetical protein